MLQYFLNASTIWLLSLLVFDIFLSKETYHSYNRFYLLTTFALGLLLPLWQWPGVEDSYNTALQFVHPVMRQTNAVRESITNSDTVATVLSIESLLILLYLAGVTIFSLLTIWEAFSLVRNYSRGKKFKDGVWTIIETGKQHSPYSAFRYVFISSKEDYSEEQLHMILLHEEQHGHLLHFFDLIIMQLAKIACWFHPLVYMYAERLSIVHEYQADAAVDKAPKEYGTFLIEQAILKPAPKLSHSFNRSPIKKRIVMLTRQSSTLSKAKTLLMLPLCIIFILCFSKNAFSDDTRSRKGNKVTYRGNTIEFLEFPPLPPDTTIVYEAETGKESIKISMMDGPNIKAGLLNGERIYDGFAIDSINKTGFHAFTYKPFLNNDELIIYLLANLKPEVKELKDGTYAINVANLILDKKGKIVYFEVDSVVSQYHTIKVNTQLQQRLKNKIASILNDAPGYEAACIEKKHVPFVFREVYSRGFTVKSGKITKF